jgi:hypothetical protein
METKKFKGRPIYLEQTIRAACPRDCLIPAWPPPTVEYPAMSARMCYSLPGAEGGLSMSRHHQIERAAQEIRRMRARIADHRLGLNSMTVRGFPTQSATDVLNKLSAELVLLERSARLLRL